MSSVLYCFYESSHLAQPLATYQSAALSLRQQSRVPDLVAKNLIVLFAGINPGLYTAAIGRHFGRPGNRFWPALHGGGFTPRLFSPFESSLLLDLNLGITNVVDRATARADELTDDELRAGGRAWKPKSNAGARPSWRSSASATTASSPASKTRASACKRPPSAAATPGSFPTPAVSTPITSPPPSHNSSATFASGQSHSTCVDEIPVVNWNASARPPNVSSKSAHQLLAREIDHTLPESPRYRMT